MSKKKSSIKDATVWYRSYILFCSQYLFYGLAIIFSVCAFITDPWLGVATTFSLSLLFVVVGVCLYIGSLEIVGMKPTQ
jgi:hypothetical protein